MKCFSVGSNHIFIPVERFFLITIQGSGSIVVAVYVDVAVAFFQLCCGRADKVDAAPGCVAHNIYAVPDSLFNLKKMFLKELRLKI